MNFVEKAWNWTKGNLDWVAIGFNALLVMGVIYYTLQTTATTAKFEIQNKQLIEQNRVIMEDNKNLREILNSARGHFDRQNEFIQKQQIIIKSQEQGIQKLIERIKELHRLLGDDFIASRQNEISLNV